MILLAPRSPELKVEGILRSSFNAVKPSIGLFGFSQVGFLRKKEMRSFVNNNNLFGTGESRNKYRDGQGNSIFVNCLY